jgi:hypothetical protein
VTSRERAEALLHKLEMSNAPYAQRLDAVERAIVEAAAEEREACAKVAMKLGHSVKSDAMATGAYAAATAIRALGASNED